uniref:LRRNT domain-containing protein n=1 Tax=Monopterus albus TaxID=43700 RepID=A0A3Q3JBU8_MONAL
MHPIVSQLLGKANVGGSHCEPATATLLLLLCFGFPPSVATCPFYCLCASDIISCSGHNLSRLPSDVPSYATRLDLSHNALTVLPVAWIPQPLNWLATLVLSRNSINRIEMNAFTVTPHLLHLDLSSNQITVLNSSIFTGLKDLKELLLFGNQIVQINPGAFSDLHNLQSGIYLQENPLVCDCAFLRTDLMIPLKLSAVPGQVELLEQEVHPLLCLLIVIVLMLHIHFRS